MLLEAEIRLEGALNALHGNLASLRTGRPSSSLLDSVRVLYHGSPTQLDKLALVSPEPGAVIVRPFDPGDLRLIEHAIAESGLGLTTQAGKTTIRVPIPALTQERREELVVVARRHGEEAKIAVRNVRRDVVRDVSALGLSEDGRRRSLESVESMVKRHVETIDEAVQARVAEILGEMTRWRSPATRKRKGRDHDACGYETC